MDNLEKDEKCKCCANLSKELRLGAESAAYWQFRCMQLEVDFDTLFKMINNYCKNMTHKIIHRDGGKFTKEDLDNLRKFLPK